MALPAMRISPYLYAIASLMALPLAAGAQTPSVILSIDIPTSSVQAGQTIAIPLTFQKTQAATEKRLVFILELHSATSDTLLASAVADNAGHGCSGNSGSVPLSLDIPSDASGNAWFIAYAAPWSLNRAIVETYKSYPTDGTYPYLWSGGGYGVTQNLYYLGTLIAPTNASHTTYCSGITFETFLTTFNSYNATYGHARIGTMAAADMQNFRKLWYGVTDAEKLSTRAIVDYGVGEEITDLEEVQEGDFVQIWRHSGSGHSFVFVEWIRDASQAIIGFRYWSSQSSTNGLGYGTEYFGDTTGVNRNRFWPARLRKPRDPADIEWALGQTDSRSRPILILPLPPPENGWMLH